VAVERFVDGSLAAEQLAGIDRHLDACPGCRNRVAAAARELEQGAGPAEAQDVPSAGPPVRFGPAPDLFVGQLVSGRYRILRRIGQGGMGAVYEAEHDLIGQRFAIKVLLPHGL
jgi:anti-sigma factor RsiW